MVHRIIPLLVAAAAIVLMGWPEDSEAAETKTSTAPKKTAPAAAAKKTTAPAKKTTASAPKKTTPTAKKSAPAAKTSPSTASKRKTTATAKKGAKRTTRPPAPRGQLQPTPERNKEIQQALIDRGYLAPPPTGVWGLESVDALRRFQQEHNLNATGKLDSLTLIALGLGPKRSVTAQVRTDNENRSSEGNQGP